MGWVGGLARGAVRHEEVKSCIGRQRVPQRHGKADPQAWRVANRRSVSLRGAQHCALDHVQIASRVFNARTMALPPNHAPARSGAAAAAAAAIVIERQWLVPSQLGLMGGSGGGRGARGDMSLPNTGARAQHRLNERTCVILDDMRITRWSRPAGRSARSWPRRTRTTMTSSSTRSSCRSWWTSCSQSRCVV